MKVKIITESGTRTEETVSGQLYTKNARGAGDLEEKINVFLSERPYIAIVSMVYGTDQITISMHFPTKSATITVKNVKILYDDYKKNHE